MGCRPDHLDACSLDKQAIQEKEKIVYIIRAIIDETTSFMQIVEVYDQAVAWVEEYTPAR